MKIRTIALFLLLVVMAVFLVINWGALSAETTVNLVYTEIQAPLGILVVCGFAALIVLMLIYTVWQAASVTLELRSAYKETRNARALADDAEKSRFTESNKLLIERIEKLESLLLARNDELGQEVRRLRDEMGQKFAAVNTEVAKQQDVAVSKVTESLGAFERRLHATLPAPVVEEVKPEDKPDPEEEVDTKKKKSMFEDLF